MVAIYMMPICFLLLICFNFKNKNTRVTSPHDKALSQAHQKKVLSFLLLGTLLSLPVLLVYFFLSCFGPINDGFPCVFTQLNTLYNFLVF